MERVEENKSNERIPDSKGRWAWFTDSYESMFRSIELADRAALSGILSMVPFELIGQNEAIPAKTGSREIIKTTNN